MPSPPAPPSPSAPPKPRRIHVHRRRTRAHRLRHAALRLLAASLCATAALSLLTHLCFPRTLSAAAVRHLAAALRAANFTSPAALSSAVAAAPHRWLASAPLPSTHALARRKTRTILLGSPPLLAHLTTLYYTPVESLALLELPATAQSGVIVAGGVVTRSLHHVHGARFSITPLSSLPPSNSPPPSPPPQLHARRAAFALAVPHGPALALLHSDGPQLTAALMHAAKETLLTADPTRVAVVASVHIAETARFFGRLCLAVYNALPDPLAGARGIAAEARRRGQQANA